MYKMYKYCDLINQAASTAEFYEYYNFVQHANNITKNSDSIIHCHELTWIIECQYVGWANYKKEKFSVNKVFNF